jgi:hypothetical protein
VPIALRAPYWFLLLPVQEHSHYFLFTAMHECIHDTASRVHFSTDRLQFCAASDHHSAGMVSYFHLPTIAIPMNQGLIPNCKAPNRKTFLPM